MSRSRRWRAPWIPATPVDWLTPAAAVLEIATVDIGGSVRWVKFDARDNDHPADRSLLASYPAGYSAVCFVAPGALVAVTTDNEVRWLNAGASWLFVTASVRLEVPTRVFALVPRPDTNEVIAVLADGHAIRVQRPRPLTT